MEQGGIRVVMTEQELLDKLEKMKIELEEFTLNVNLTIAHRQGKIAMLEELLKKEETPNAD